MLRLAKATILWNLSVKMHRYRICGVVATSISGCGVCTVCIFTDQFHKIVALARLSISSLRLVQVDRNM